MLGAAVGLNGVPITIVTRNVKPPWFLKKVEEIRLSVHTKAAYEPRTLPALMRALRNGESVGFVIDQYAPPPMGVKVKFFGVEVDTLAAVAPLALRTGAAVVPTGARRDADGIIHVKVEPEIHFGKDLEDPVKVTQALANKVEAWIREEPSQWLWGHRRFKNVSWPDDLNPA
jgi:KDO2-lipid IV(A) lauroyltransferase